MAGHPAGVLPVTTETEQDQQRLEQYAVGGDICHRWGVLRPVQEVELYMQVGQGRHSRSPRMSHRSAGE